MSRSLGLFLLFLVGLALLGVVGAWYLGPSLVSLAFDEERRNAPYYLLNLVADPDQDATQHAASSSTFQAALAELVASDDGQLLWRAATLQVAEGRVEDEWQDLQLFEFPRGGDFVEMLTSTRYREIVDAHPRLARLALGTGHAPDGIASTGAAVLSLFRVGEQTAEFSQGTRELASNLGEFQGGLIWDAPLTDLEGEMFWNHILLFEFENVAAAEGWLRDPGTVTQRSLIQRGAQGTVTLILQSL